MSTAIFNTWFAENISLLPRADEEDPELPSIGVTIFNRAPLLDEDSTLTGWASAIELDELIQSPHWQPPGRYVDGVLELEPVAALAQYFTQVVDGRNIVRLAGEDPDFVISNTMAPTSTPVVALAFWFDGTIGGKFRPLIMMVQLDSPVLLMADEKYPTRLSAALLFTWEGGE